MVWGADRLLGVLSCETKFVVCSEENKENFTPIDLATYLLPEGK